MIISRIKPGIYYPRWYSQSLLVFLLQLENIVQENVRSGMEEMKRSAVHTQTAAMLQMGTNLLSQSAEQTRKLTDVETQVSPSGSHSRYPQITCRCPAKTNVYEGKIHVKINDVLHQTLDEYLIKCKSDVTRWEALPRGGGGCFQQLLCQTDWHSELSSASVPMKT